MLYSTLLVYRSEDANKAFSAAVQMYDTLVKAWALWGDYLETLFTRERYNKNLKVIVGGTCFDGSNVCDLELK